MLMDPGYPLLLAPTRAGWQRSPLSAGQAGMWLRGILMGLGENPDSLKRIGTHSCKATCLSWCAKSNECSIACWLHSNPSIRLWCIHGTLRQVLWCICNGPWMTVPARSPSQIVQVWFIRLWQTLLRVVTSVESLASAMAEEHTSDDPDLESESSSEDSRDEEFGEDDLQLAAEAENEIVPLWNQLRMMSGSMSFAQNCRLSTMYHLVADGAGSHLKCGRVIAANFDAVDDEPKFVYPMCATCFGRRMCQC